MNRRQGLKTMITGGAIWTAGCGTLFSEETTCERTADEKSLDAALRLVDEEGVGVEDISIRGTIATVTEDDVSVFDETGVGRLYVGLNREFNTDQLSSGDCVAVEGGLDKHSSWSAQMPVISASKIERKGKTGGTERLDRIANASAPDVLFDVDFRSEYDECGSEVVLTHSGNEPVPADELSVIYGPEREYPRNPTLENTTERPWTEFEETEVVTESDTISLEVEPGTAGAVLWRSGTGRNAELKGWGVGESSVC